MNGGEPGRPRKVDVFDYVTRQTNAIGKCYLTLVNSLPEYSFTIYSVESDALPRNAVWEQVRAIRRPLFALFLSFRLATFFRHRKAIHSSSLSVQTETALGGADIIYMHFCHLEYTPGYFREMRKLSLRSWVRLLDHLAHACMEIRLLPRAENIVVPTSTLAGELVRHGARPEAITVIPNPAPAAIKVSELAPVGDYCVFVAAGQFHRKGLHRLLEALQSLKPSWVLRVIGGSPAEVSRAAAQAASIAPDVRTEFLGHSSNPLPHMSSARALIVASDYEVMPMVILESLSVGTPVIATPVGGTPELIDDGQNGVISTSISATGLAEAIRRFDAVYAAHAESMRHAAIRKAGVYGPQRFADRWRDVLGLA